MPACSERFSNRPTLFLKYFPYQRIPMTRIYTPATMRVFLCVSFGVTWVLKSLANRYVGGSSKRGRTVDASRPSREGIVVVVFRNKCSGWVSSPFNPVEMVVEMVVEREQVCGRLVFAATFSRHPSAQHS